LINGKTAGHTTRYQESIPPPIIKTIVHAKKPFACAFWALLKKDIGVLEELRCLGVFLPQFWQPNPTKM
jgi:hypothetical protein